MMITTAFIALTLSMLTLFVAAYAVSYASGQAITHAGSFHVLAGLTEALDGLAQLRTGPVAKPAAPVKPAKVFANPKSVRFSRTELAISYVTMAALALPFIA